MSKFKEIDFKRCPGHTAAVTSTAQEIATWPQGDPRRAWYELTRFRDEWKNTRAPVQHQLAQLTRLFQQRLWEQVQYDNGCPVFQSFEDLCYRLLLQDPVEVLQRIAAYMGVGTSLGMLPNLKADTRARFERAQRDGELAAELTLLEGMAAPVGRPPANENVRTNRQCNTDDFLGGGREARREARAEQASPGWVRDLATQGLITSNLQRYLGSTGVRTAPEYEQRLQAFREAADEAMPEPGANRQELASCRRQLEQVVRTLFPDVPATVAGGPMVVRLSPTDPEESAAKIAAKVEGDYLRAMVKTLTEYLDSDTTVDEITEPTEKKPDRARPYSVDRVLRFAEVVEQIQLQGDARVIARECCDDTESWEGWMVFMSSHIPDDSPITSGSQLSALINHWPSDHDRVRVRSAHVNHALRLKQSGVTEHAPRRVNLLKVL